VPCVTHRDETRLFRREQLGVVALGFDAVDVRR
jgi:hypothetical protein